MKTSIGSFIIALFLCAVQPLEAKIWLPSVLSDHMVLQQESNITIWGWTTATSETISVSGSWNNEKVSVEAYQGKWTLQLQTPKAGGPYTLTISGHEQLVLEDVLIGEVWVASGQSNMEWTPKHGLLNAETEIEAAQWPSIRFFQIDKQIADHPQENSSGHWVVCSPESMQDFSSVAYFFGRELHTKLSVPVGLISTNWGGTPIETWIPEALIHEDKELKEAAEQLTPRAWWPHGAGLAFNAMVYPLVNYQIAGCIWYQGESNRENASSYYTSFPVLIRSWRKLWKKDFPFYFAQIAPFKYDKPESIGAAIVRDAQLQTMLTVPKTGMAVTNDIGNLENIHPINKQEVGRRLALWALAKDYQVKSLGYFGPLYRNMEVDKNKIILSFDHTGSGLMKKGKTLTHFTIAGEDQVFYPAKATIKDNQVIVRASEVKKPVAVRFAFTDTAEPNLYNSLGLPASAFRTDTWNINP